MRRLLALILVLLLVPFAAAWADCTNPAKSAGAVVFNTDHNTLEYCNGSSWVTMGKAPSAMGWTERTAAQANQWMSVVYGNGLFVAVAQSGTNRVMTSSDGITWTARTAAQANAWVSVTYGNGLFVAVSNGGTNRVMTSPDGITWTARTAPASTWYAVTFGNGLFAAVGLAAAMTSPDGITWTARTPSESVGWQAITYGNGAFVAVAESGTNKVMRSTDGITWTGYPAASATQYRAVAYGNGLFVAGGDTGALMTSPDGMTWTARTGPAGGSQWYGLTYGNGLFVVVALNGTHRVATSPDGITWTEGVVVPANSQWEDVTFGNGRFVAVAYNSPGNMVMTAESGCANPTGTPGKIVYDTDHHTMRYCNGADWVAMGRATSGSALQAVTFDGTNDHLSNNVTGAGTGFTFSFWIRPHVQAADADQVIFSNASTNFQIILRGNSDTDNLYSLEHRFKNTAGTSITWGITPETIAAGVWTHVYVSSQAGTGQKAYLNDSNNLGSSGSGAGGTPDFYSQPFYVGRSPTGAPMHLKADIAEFWMDDSYMTGATVANRRKFLTADLKGENLGAAGVTPLAAAPVIYLSGPESTWFTNQGNGGGFVQTGDLTEAPAPMPPHVNDAPGACTAPVRDEGMMIYNTDQCAMQYCNGAGWTGVGKSNPCACDPNAGVWMARTAAQSNQWISVTYGNGLFVAVSNTGSNRVMTSPDGIIWTQRTAAQLNDWRSVTYGGGLFVAVSTGGTNQVMTSPDGITWTGRTAAQADLWMSVAYGAGTFVAVAGSGGSNRVMTSPDGITWTTRTAAQSNQWNAVTYGNGLFVAVSLTGTNRVMTSPDGITWTVRNAAEANQWFSVTYGNGLFVAVASTGTNRIMTSPDGITWTARAGAEASFWRNVTYGDGLFVAVNSDGTNRVMFSPDGINWTAQAAVEANSWMAVTYGNGQFVATAFSGINRVMTVECLGGG